jgi:DNA repair protein RadC
MKGIHLRGCRPYEFSPAPASVAVRELGQGAATDTPEQLFAFAEKAILGSPTYDPLSEHVWVIPMNHRMFPVGICLITIGDESETMAPPAKIMRAVICSGQRKFVLLHNHPSGLVTPSAADHRVTETVKRAAETLQIELVDHLVINLVAPDQTRFFSFRESGVI